MYGLETRKKSCCDLTTKAQGDSCPSEKQQLQDICSNEAVADRGALFSLFHEVCEGETHRLQKKELAFTHECILHICEMGYMYTNL